MNQNIATIINRQFQDYIPDIKESIKLLDEEDILLSYDKKNKDISIKVLKKLNQGLQYRIQLLVPYIQLYIQKYNPKSFDLVICLGDILKHNYSLPSLCFSRKKTVNSILIPNIDFFTGAIYQFFKEVESNDIEYNDKSNTSIFIGSSTGTFKNNTRLKFCKQCKNLIKHKAYINNLCQSDKSEWVKEYGDIEYILHGPISITQQLKNKVVINIDGNTMCWSRLYWQMRSNSIPVYINKTSEDVQFFDYIQHSEGYISCSIDNAINTIEEILETSPETIEKINKAGKKYTSECFDEYINNPQFFLQSIIDKIFTKLIEHDI